MCEPNGRPVRPGSVYARSLQSRGVTLGPCGGKTPPRRVHTLPTTGMCGPTGRQVRPGSAYALSLQNRGVTLKPCGQSDRHTGPVAGGHQSGPHGRPTLPTGGHSGQTMCEPSGRQVNPGSIYARSLTARGVTLSPCAQTSRPAVGHISRPAFPKAHTKPVAGGHSVRPTLPAAGGHSGRPNMRPVSTLPQMGAQSQSLCEPNGRRVIPGSIYARSLTARGVTIGPCAARGARATEADASTYDSASTTSTPAWGVALIVLSVVVLVVLAIVIVKLVMFLKRD